MEISNGSAWSVLLLVGVLSALVGYSFSNKAASSPPRANSLESIIEQTKAEYEALTPSLDAQVQKMVKEINERGEQVTANVFFEYTKDTKNEEKKVNGLTQYFETPVEQVIASQYKLNVEAQPAEIERSGSVTYPYKAVFNLVARRQCRTSSPQELSGVPVAIDGPRIYVRELNGSGVTGFDLLYGMGFDVTSHTVPEHLKTLAAKAETECKTAKWVDETRYSHSRRIELRFSAATHQWEYWSNMPAKF